jgi:hypothetical protein
MLKKIKYVTIKCIYSTINENPSERIMELALAANDDIYIVHLHKFYRLIEDLKIYNEIKNHNHLF